MRGCRYGIFFFAVFIAASLLFGCSSPSSDKEQVAKKTGDPEAKEVLPDQNKPGCTIAPGSSRTFRFTGPVPFFHSTNTSPTLQIEYALAGNSWKAGGVGVGLDYSEISQHSGNIWTYKSPVKNVKTGGTYIQNRPVDPTGAPAPVKAEIHVPDRPLGGDVLVQDSSTHKFIEQGKMSWSELKKAWKIHEKTAEARKKLNTDQNFYESRFENKPFAFYRFTIDFTVSIPGDNKLEEIDKASRSNETELLFYPKRVVFKNDKQTREWTMNEGFNRVPVVMSLSRKPGGGYSDVVIKTFRPGYELTCE